jgi:hypothetical protein
MDSFRFAGEVRVCVVPELKVVNAFAGSALASQEAAARIENLLQQINAFLQKLSPDFRKKWMIRAMRFF